MSEEVSHQLSGRARGTKEPHRFRELLHALLHQANKSASRLEFLRHASGIVMEFARCDALEVRVEEGGKAHRCRGFLSGEGAFRLDCRPPSGPGAVTRTPGMPLGAEEGFVSEEILRAVLARSFAPVAPFFTRGGSFWTGDTAHPILLREDAVGGQGPRTVVIGGEYQSIALVPVPVDARMSGVLYLGSRKRDFFAKDDVLLLEAAAETLGVALAHQAAQWALGERIKELTCLYGIAKVLQRPDVSLEELLRETVELLPPGWQYPDITSARISLDRQSFATADFRESPFTQSADVIVDGELRGIVEVAYAKEMPDADEGPFLREERNLIDAVAETLGVALGHRQAQWALGERIKELTCLYGIARLAQRRGLPVEDLFSEVATLLPQGWQYPEVTFARITLDGKTYGSPGFEESPFKLSAELLIDGKARGTVEVVYTEEKLPADEGPFLREERSLINAAARQLSLIIENREAEEERSRLEEQLRHADRLATIGQLVAGAAHELNEPLGGILGFAQLAKDCPGLPKQAEQDLDRIVNSALHAREVIKKLMIFARQMPAQKTPCNMNHLVLEGLYFLESRCAREGIKLVHQLDPDIPEFLADPSQIHQVLVNLVVNAIQAMPQGGALTLTTKADREHVSLVVQDTGVGMTEDVLKQVFIPFFTTKEVGQGTGLGLSVVHGIVTSHGGTIHVESQPGRGSRFSVRIPIMGASSEEEEA